MPRPTRPPAAWRAPGRCRPPGALTARPSSRTRRLACGSSRLLSWRCSAPTTGPGLEPARASAAGGPTCAG
eukprot:2313963-Lingulodinium_polyedra.AAC.1